MQNPDIVIVGAGPVGLLLASHMATLFKSKGIDKKILIVEKYQEYRRANTLNVEANSIEHDHLAPDLRALLATFVGRTPTLELQKKLESFAKQQGVEIEYQEVKSCETLAQSYPSAKTIIGADGAHSVVRNQIFKDELEVDSDLQYVLQVTYKTNNKAESLPWWQIGYQQLQTNHLVNEFIRPGKEGELSSVSFQIVLSREEHAALDLFAKAKDNIGVDDPRIPPRVKTTIDTWMQARNDQVAENSAKISAVRLSVYSSKNVTVDTSFSGTIQKWILCGDSLFGVPYFRSLNNGWKSALHLGYSLFLHSQGLEYENEYAPVSSKISSVSLSTTLPQEPLQRYQQFVKSLESRERFRAKFKAVKYQSFDSTVASGRKISAVSPSSSSGLSTLYNAVTSLPNLGMSLFSKARSFLPSFSFTSTSRVPVTGPKSTTTCKFRKQ